MITSPSEAFVSWQWTHDAIAGAVKAQLGSKFPELPCVVTQVLFTVGAFMFVSRRKLRRRA